jgi:peptidyl-prolyl cis-trans isomerase D
MISWIQRTFQQHFKWLFLALLAVVIVSFVFITNASSGFGHTGAKQAPARPFFGVNLESGEDMQELVKDASLSAHLQGMQIRSESQLNQYMLQRHAALHLADELNLPPPSNDDLANHIKTLRAFSGQDGKFDAKRYAEFRDNLKTNPQLQESDVTRVLADDVIYQQVTKLLSGPGYVLPADIQNQLNRSESTWTLEAAIVDYSTFKPDITVTDEALSQYFEYNAPRYEIAAKVAVSYIDFPASAYTGKVTVTEEGLRAFYDANPARFPKPADKNPATPSLPSPSTHDSDFAAVRQQVEDAYRLERAQALAMNAASDFAVALFDKKVTPATLDAFLASRQLTRKALAPFNSENVPAELGVDHRVGTEALKTSAQHPFSDPVKTGRGAAILVWNESIPARQPELAEVKDRVRADYLDAEKHKRFAEAGKVLRGVIEERLKAGDTLAKAVEAASKTIPAKVTTKSWPAFTLANPPQDLDYSAYSAIVSLQKGQLSEMVTTPAQGMIVHVADKKLPELDPSSAKYIEMRDRLASFTATRDGNALLASIVDAELAKTAPATP